MARLADHGLFSGIEGSKHGDPLVCIMGAHVAFVWKSFN